MLLATIENPGVGVIFGIGGHLACQTSVPSLCYAIYEDHCHLNMV
jgi:hypothetical protein